MAPHGCSGQKSVEDPCRAPSQNDKDYRCFTYDLKRSAINFLQTPIILTISTHCYTPRTLQGTSHKSQALPLQSTHTTSFVRQGISPFSDASSDLLTNSNKPHVITHYEVNKAKSVLCSCPVYNAEGKILQDNIKTAINRITIYLHKLGIPLSPIVFQVPFCPNSEMQQTTYCRPSTILICWGASLPLSSMS